MDELKAPEQNLALARIADLLRKAEQESNPEFLPRSLNVMGLFADLFLPSSRTVEKMSYGDPLFRMPQQSRIPITTDKEYVADVLGMAPAVPAASRATTRLSNEAADAMVRQITGRTDATAMRALEEIGQMSPVPQMFDPKLAKQVIPETIVVDKAGNPKLVYHGTGQLTDEDEAIKEFQTFNPAWFGEETSTADLYANTRGLSPTVYPSYLDIKKPLEIKVDMNDDVSQKGGAIRRVLREIGLDEDDFPGWQNMQVWEVVSSPRFMEAAMDSGFDGIAVKEGGKQTYGVFDASQIKSAISESEFENLIENPLMKDTTK